MECVSQGVEKSVVICFVVIPVQTGIHFLLNIPWIPAFAGMTE